MAPVLAMHAEPALSEQPHAYEPLFVPTEPLFIHNPFAEVPEPVEDAQARKESGKSKQYYPGAMLAESAATTFGQQFGNATTATMENDAGAESDCSTTDTNEAVTSMQMGVTEAPAPGMFMMHNMGMLESPWPTYMPPAPGCWMPYQPMPTCSMPSAGSGGHRLGRCKPCAFFYKDGCNSGANCVYCHLCPPGEKQRRKRLMRTMQRTMERTPLQQE